MGATVSWLMANSGRLQTERDRGVRESKDQVSFSSLSHIMSGGQLETLRGGGCVRCEFLAGVKGCAGTHVILKRDINMSLSCGSIVSIWRPFHLKQTSRYTPLVC